MSHHDPGGCLPAGANTHRCMCCCVLCHAVRRARRCIYGSFGKWRSLAARLCVLGCWVLSSGRRPRPRRSQAARPSGCRSVIIHALFLLPQLLHPTPYHALGVKLMTLACAQVLQFPAGGKVNRSVYTATAEDLPHAVGGSVIATSPELLLPGVSCRSFQAPQGADPLLCTPLKLLACCGP